MTAWEPTANKKNSRIAAWRICRYNLRWAINPAGYSPRHTNKVLELVSKLVVHSSIMFIIAAAQSQVVKLCSTQTSIIVTLIGNEMRHSHTAVTTPSTLRLLLARTTLGPHRSRAESRRLLLARDYFWPVTPLLLCEHTSYE